MEVICANKLCNKVFDFKGGFAHFRRAKRHYCCRSCQNTIHGLAGTPKHKIWQRTKKRAKENRTTFRLTIFDIPDIPDICPILGIKIQPNDKAGPIDSSPSIDRIVPNLGYVPGNIRIISNRANRLRADATVKELELLLKDAKDMKCEYSR